MNIFRIIAIIMKYFSPKDRPMKAIQQVGKYFNPVVEWGVGWYEQHVDDVKKHHQSPQ